MSDANSVQLQCVSCESVATRGASGDACSQCCGIMVPRPAGGYNAETVRMLAQAPKSAEFDYLIYIGRFRPLHLGHQSAIDSALKQAKIVVILAGSANRPVGEKNPWTYAQVKDMIQLAYPAEVDAERIIVLPLNDVEYNDDQWVGQVQSKIATVVDRRKIVNYTPRIGIIGFEKDDSSYYLKKFPQWERVEAEQWGLLSATDVRKQFFRRSPIIPRDVLSPPIVEYLRQMMNTDQFRYVLRDTEETMAIRDKWKDSPYEPHFCAADCVVVQSGHVLLVEKSLSPGIGLLALPGGHVDPKVGDAFANALKELWEEAQPSNPAIKRSDGRNKPMPVDALLNYYTGTERRFDKPGRDPRGFYSTTAFRFNFPDGPLWPVSGGHTLATEVNDVSGAAWYPIGSLDPRKMYGDHYFIIQQMLGDTK